jgi:hypothetical protein
MPGGGLFTLVSYGAQNTILSGNPQMTYFYKSFRRYSHFSEESVTTTFDGSNELSNDQFIQIRVKIQRVADLVRDMYFTFTLPDIYSKWVDTEIGDRKSQLNFAWTPYIGCTIIQNVALIIGGTKVQEFDGNYILARALADYDTDRFAKWKYLVGQTNELTNPAVGEWGGGSQTVGYPTVYPDVTATTQLNRPSIFGRDIHVPLPFFCNESTYQALPLIGLQYHEVEIQIQLRPVRDLYTFLDDNGYRVAYGYQQSATQAQLNLNLPSYVVASCEDGEIRNFLTDIGVTPPAINNLYINPRLQATYVYLTEDERQTFASTPLSYMIYQVTRYSFPNVTTREYLQLETHNPINRLLTVSRRSDYIYRNDWTNWTNWWNYPTPPHIPTPALPPWANYFYATGLLVPTGQQGIIRALRVLGDGNELQEEKPGNWFETVVPYRYATGQAAPGLYNYSFGLTSPGIQPNGSINSSRIRLFQLDVDVYPLPLNTNYVYDITVYVESINWFQISSGMGGVKYAL